MTSTPHFGLLCFSVLFDRDELSSDHNVLGRPFNGVKKLALDTNRITYLQSLCLDVMSSEERKNVHKAWSQCVTACNKKMYEVHRNNSRNNS